MFHLLKRHPFAVKAEFDYSAVMTYAFPADVLAPLLPPGLTVDQRDGRGFVAVAMVKTRNLRPGVMPRWMGQDFFLIGYRIFTRFTTLDGRHLRGLYILKSQTDRFFMTLSGNLLTHYHYEKQNIRSHRDGSSIHVEAQGALDVSFYPDEGASLPPGSPFQDWREARMFAGPLPFTFNYEPETRSIIVVEGVRGNWVPVPATARVGKVAFLDGEPFKSASPVFASAFVVESIPYMWKRGRLEKVPLDAPHAG